MVNLPGHDHPGDDQGEDSPVAGGRPHSAELGAVAATAVAAGVHSGTEKIGAGEAADEDRDEQAPEAPRALYGAALIKRDAAGGMRAGEAFDLLDKGRDKLYRDDEDQHQLVDRNPKPLQGTEN